MEVKKAELGSNIKRVKHIPIHKKGDHSNFGNYRPISLLPAISKILEKLVYNRMMSFLDQNSILSDSQYGFRKGRSADLAMLTLTEKNYESVEKDEFLIGIFLDLSKAFDTLSHTILLNKLSSYGFRGMASDWIANYLTSLYHTIIMIHMYLMLKLVCHKVQYWDRYYFCYI